MFQIKVASVVINKNADDTQFHPSPHISLQ